MIIAMSESSSSAVPKKVAQAVREKFKALPGVLVLAKAPSNAILRHPHTRVFVTSAGINSAMEAALALVPMVAVPKQAEQFASCMMLKARHYGVCAHEASGP